VKQNDLKPFIFFVSSLIVCIFCLGFFYSNFLHKLLPLKFALSPLESVYLWYLKANFVLQPENTFIEPNNQVLYFYFLKLLKVISPQNYSFWARGINCVSTFVSLFLLAVILRLEKVDFFVTLMALAVLLSLTLTQEFSFLIGGGPLGLLVGLLAIYCMYLMLKKPNIMHGFLIGLFLALAWAFTHDFAFLSFAVSVFLAIVLKLPAKELLKVYVPFIIFVLLDVFLTTEVSSMKGLFVWSFPVFMKNIKLIYCWPLYGLFMILMFHRDSLEGLKTNWFHPAFSLLISSLFLVTFSSGSSLGQSGGWLIVALSICWITALFIQQLYVSENNSVFFYCAVLLLFCGFMSTLLEPPQLKTLIDNSKILLQTEKSMTETKSMNIPVLTQDSSLVKVKDSQVVDLSKIFIEKKAYEELKLSMEDRKYSAIYAATEGDNLFPSEILKTLKSNYTPSGKVFVLGSQGALFVPKTNLHSFIHPASCSRSSSGKESFATLRPI
jgi:hypothetical protein